MLPIEIFIPFCKLYIGVYLPAEQRDGLSEELRWSMVVIKWNIILEMPQQFKHNLIVRLLNTCSITQLDIQIPNL